MAIADYLNKLIELKNQLVANLKSMGVTADESEKLNTLVPKVLDIESGTDTSDATATAEDILEGKTAYVGGVKLTGESKTPVITLVDNITEFKANTSSDSNNLNTIIKKVVLPEGCTTFNVNNNPPLPSLVEFRCSSTVTSVSGFTYYYYISGLPSATKKLFSPVKLLTVPCSGLTNDFYYKISSSESLVIQPTEFSFVKGSDGGTTISKSSFYKVDTTNLETSIIADGVTEIADTTYYNCENLLNVSLPDSIISIGYNAFTNTAIINQQTDDPVKYIDKWAVQIGTGTTAIIKEGTVGLSKNLFTGTGIKSVTLPRGLKYYSNDVFYNSYIENITLPDDFKTIPQSFFIRCNFKNVEIPRFITTIDSYSFALNENLVEVTLNTNDGENILDINEYAFNKCTSLKSINLENIHIIKNNAFNNCTSLKVIPKNIYKIYSTAFTGVPVACPGIGADCRQIPWGASNIHDFDENGLCQLCGHQTPILFCERTTATFKKAASAVSMNGGTYGGYRSYSWTSGGTGTSDVMPIKVFEETSVTFKMKAYNIYYTKEYFYFKFYMINENGSSTRLINKEFHGSGSEFNNSTDEVTLTLEPGTYEIRSGYSKSMANTYDSRGGYYYIPEFLTYF